MTSYGESAFVDAGWTTRKAETCGLVADLRLTGTAGRLRTARVSRGPSAGALEFTVAAFGVPSHRTASSGPTRTLLALLERLVADEKNR